MDRPAVVILAGGRSSRMGGSRKALLEFDGRPLLSHVLSRLLPQTDLLMLNCDRQNEALENFGLPLIPDLIPGYQGPLMGLYSAMQYLSDRGRCSGLVLSPCDAPFIPASLVQTLIDAEQTDEEPVVAISYEGVLQPTFSLWHQHHLPLIRTAVVEKGYGSLKHLFYALPHKIVEWVSTEPPPFFNINTPHDLISASGFLD